MSSTLAVSMMMGNRQDSRMRWQRVNPFISGSITSRIARSSRVRLTQIRASAAL